MYWSVIAELALVFLAGVLFGAALSYLILYVPRVPLDEPRKAMLLSADGRLDSVRTLIGPPPDAIACAAGTYHRDRTAQSDHWVYRRV